MDDLPMIYNEPCNCPAGQCARFVEPDTKCVNRLSGDVHTTICEPCRAITWHQNGECLPCRRRGEKEPPDA